ncbi:T9SS type A sorting domain-containing protein [uncultured Draconibacterium sp.]|uniref:T9SS type A sorting domain-containing protein n=1 Tax=uncultured Draconibacterium sp. TaxID=1573823 RepID=UPI003216411C
MKKYILVFLILLFILPAFSQGSWNFSSPEKEKIEADLKIYPNPCKNSKVTVDFNSNEIAEVTLTNITGKQVLRKEYEFPTYKTQLLLNDIPDGLYLIQVVSSDKKTVVKKLIVSKN